MMGRDILQKYKPNIFINEDLATERKKLTNKCPKLRYNNKISRDSKWKCIIENNTDVHKVGFTVQ